MNKKTVYSLTKFTTTDYPDKLSCIVWFTSCNMRCQYCYNDALVNTKNGQYSPLDVLDFLRTRVGLLDAVVLSGGEATLHDLKEFCIQIKDLGFLIKLDTNGLNPNLVKELVKDNLIDYLALDFKAPENKFNKITNSNKYKEFNETLDYLITIDFTFEVRSTVHPDLLNVDDINSIINILINKGYKKDYYLQNFLETESNLGNITNSETSFNIDKLFTQGLHVVWRN